MKSLVRMSGVAVATVFVMLASISNTFAASVTCSTNVQRNPELGETTYKIVGQGSSLEIIQQSNGGLAQYITAPYEFPVQATPYGPEVVVYSDAQNDFKLEISYQPIGGVIYGVVYRQISEKTDQTPVVCEVTD